MEDEFDVDEIVSLFFLNTCLPRFRVNDCEISALANCANIVTRFSTEDEEFHITPFATGSIAELHIDPLVSCISDMDIMYHRSDELAIPAGYSLPTQLPAQCDSRANIITVWEINDSGFPGYVHLVSFYFLEKCSEDGQYDVVHCKPTIAAHIDSEKTHGPATVIKGPFFADGVRKKPNESLDVLIPDGSLDFVYCLPCLVWPPQATDWPSRHRNYGWPDSATIDHVVGNGCDVVQVAHPLCRQDEWMNMHQHRLSFSRAEIVLLNKWMTVQQIVYLSHVTNFHQDRTTDRKCYQL